MGLRLKNLLDEYMQKVLEVRDYCKRCLEVKRWGGSVVLMVLDAAFTSVGLNYFQIVVPRVERFRQEFVRTGEIDNLEGLMSIDPNDEKVEKIWKNKRSWNIAKSIASYLAGIKPKNNFDDRQAFAHWARQSRLDTWQDDPIGRISGVGINTFQYLRMMAGIDTVMPDKIVKRVIGEILGKAGMEMPSNDIDFVKLVEKIAKQTGYKAIELCWMTWVIQSEAGVTKIKKYSRVLERI